MKPNAINYLSLAQKARRIEVGEEPVAAAARSGHARLVLVARDAPDNTRRRARKFVAGTNQQMVVIPFTKEEMGIALGRGVVALAAMTDPAMALAFLQSLEDPKAYGPAIEDLQGRTLRVRQHQAEEKAHLRNIRAGKVRKEPAKPKTTETGSARTATEKPPKGRSYGTRQPKATGNRPAGLKPGRKTHGGAES